MNNSYNDISIMSKTQWLKDFHVFCNISGEDVVYNNEYDLSKLHLHEFVEISIVIEGSGIHRSLEGASECVVGDVYIINAGVPHKYFNKSKSREFVVRNIIFEPESVFSDDDSLSDKSGYCYGIFKKNMLVTHMHLEPDSLKEILTIADKIEDEVSQRRHQWQTLTKAQLVTLLISLSRYLNDSEPDASSALSHKERIIVSKMMVAVIRGFQDNALTLESIASSMYLSKSYLSRIFKNVTGQYFSEYVKEVRLNQACDYLRNTNKTVEQIVHDCGMKDVQSFYRLFRSKYHITPKQYKNNITRKADADV